MCQYERFFHKFNTCSKPLGSPTTAADLVQVERVRHEVAISDTDRVFGNDLEARTHGHSSHKHLVVAGSIGQRE